MNFVIAVLEPQFLGLNVSLWLNAASIIIGVVIAAFVSPWVASRTAKRDQQERLLRVLLNTWQTPANVDYQSSIALIPLDFKGCKSILSLRTALLTELNIPPSDDAKEQSERNELIQDMQANLISAIARELNFDVTPESLRAGVYVSKGFVDRANLEVGAMIAWHRIADALERNNSMLEMQFGKLPDQPALDAPKSTPRRKSKMKASVDK